MEASARLVGRVPTPARFRTCCWFVAVTPCQGSAVVCRAYCSATKSSPAVVYEDEHLVVINKPRNMVTVPGAGREAWSVLHWLLDRYKLANHSTTTTPHTENWWPHTQNPQTGLGLVHRLDKDTTGLQVFARTRIGLDHLKTTLHDHQWTRRYLGMSTIVPICRSLPF